MLVRSPGLIGPTSRHTHFILVFYLQPIATCRNKGWCSFSRVPFEIIKRSAWDRETPEVCATCIYHFCRGREIYPLFLAFIRVIWASGAADRKPKQPFPVCGQVFSEGSGGTFLSCPLQRKGMDPSGAALSSLFIWLFATALGPSLEASRFVVFKNTCT